MSEYVVLKVVAFLQKHPVFQTDQQALAPLSAVPGFKAVSTNCN
jgi:hypothetical protein